MILIEINLFISFFMIRIDQFIIKFSQELKNRVQRELHTLGMYHCEKIRKIVFFFFSCQARAHAIDSHN